jgi:hypothetical protein
MGVPSRNDKRDYREMERVVPFLTLFQQHRMNMTLKMIHRNQGLVQREGEGFSVTDADQERSGEARTLSDRQRVDGLVRVTSVSERFADDRNNCAEMLSRG